MLTSRARISAKLILALITTLLLAAPAMAVNPYTKMNGTWINLSGEVKTVTANSFVLDYGEGVILVEMDDGDRDADGYKLLPGDKVTVSGMIDDDFFETTTIEASSVYVEKLGTTFFASAVDEEDYFMTVTVPVVVSDFTAQGIVTEVDGQEFTIDTALRTLTVDVSDMPYNPLDDEGYQKIEIGDIVRANGSIDDSFFAGRKLVADSVIEIID